MCWHIEAETILTPFRRRQFQMYFLERIYKFRIRLHWNLFPRVTLTIFQYWLMVQIMAWRRSGDKPLSEPMMVILPTHICVTRPQWVRSQFTPTQDLSLSVWSCVCLSYTSILHGFFPYLCTWTTAYKDECNDRWIWPISSRSFSNKLHKWSLILEAVSRGTTFWSWLFNESS